MKRQTTILGLLLLLTFSSACAAVDTARPLPADWPEPPRSAPERFPAAAMAAPKGWDDEGPAARERPHVGIFDLGFRIYANGLTEFDGPRCEHRPTCSVYAFRAVNKHGVVIGSFMGVDRLMRGNQSSVLRRLPIYRVHEGAIYYYDPVEANDFFL